jgi:hypothetical protein
LNRNDKRIGQGFHAGKADILRPDERSREVAEIIIPGEFVDFIFVVEVGNQDVFRVGEDVRVDG